MIWMKKAYFWIAQYWWVILTIGAGIFVMFFFPSSNRKHWKTVEYLQGNVTKRKKNYDDLVLEIERAEERKTQTLEAIEQEYGRKKEDLVRKEKKEVEKILKETENDPELVARELAERMGWEYVK